ncbi:uncharacterized protein [Erythrolamprus reginae]|uniref:uncharacterized protein n=1 Tax=Erythrolamprus reginae TaxID=121349 RepID=UPI00396CBC3A
MQNGGQDCGKEIFPADFLIDFACEKLERKVVSDDHLTRRSCNYCKLISKHPDCDHMTAAMLGWLELKGLIISTIHSVPFLLQLVTDQVIIIYEPPVFFIISSTLENAIPCWAIDAKLSAINAPSLPHPPPRPSRPLGSPTVRAPIQDESDSSQDEYEDMEEDEDPFQGLSDNEESQIKVPSPVTIFPSQLFKSLLLKARISTGLAAQEKQATTSNDPPEENLPYFTEEQEDNEWDFPASGLNPTTKDKKLYKLSSSYEDLLSFPKPDEPVKILHSAAAVPGEAEEVLRPEDKRIEQMLKRGFTADSWAIKSSAAASFFSRAMLLWLRQLQQHIPPDDLRGQQDFNKVFAAAQYVADATLQSTRFAAKSIAASTTARRLLWLRPWQAGKPRTRRKYWVQPPKRPPKRSPFAAQGVNKIKRLPIRETQVSIPPAFVPKEGTPGAEVFATKEERPLTGLLKNLDGSSSSIPIGGRLAYFSSSWRLTSKDPWVIDTVQKGLLLEFTSPPPKRFISCPSPRSSSDCSRMEEAISHLLSIRAIQPVPPGQKGRGFYSILFMVPKSSGGWRAILDLKKLNLYIKYRKFKMHSLPSILAAIHPGDFMVSLDLTEAYLHIPIAKCHRKFLRFSFQGRHFQYRAMPFGLSSAPRVFTKLLGSLAAYIRASPIHILCYLDDILVHGNSLEKVKVDLSVTMSVLQNHGFSINFDKSHLQPSTSILHLGSIINSESSQVFLSPERKNNIGELISRILLQPSVSIVTLSSLLGKMVSCIGIIPWARLHARELQWLLLPFQRSGHSNSSRRIVIPSIVRRSLKWWRSPAMDKGSPFRCPEQFVITTDASLSGWGAHARGMIAQGTWSPEEASKPINWLELRAVSLALKQFIPRIPNRHVLILTDNIATKSHICRQGGTRSKALMREALKLGLWAEKHLQSLLADHISGSLNVQADWLSRATIDPGEWNLHQDLFHQISLKFGLPVLDLFATEANAHLPRFFSRFPSPGAEAINALRSPWPPGLLYAFPPIPILPDVIHKVLSERARVILIAPHWPRRPWFADLQQLSIQDPWRLPVSGDMLRQGASFHPDPEWFHLTAWLLSGET